MLDLIVNDNKKDEKTERTNKIIQKLNQDMMDKKLHFTSVSPEKITCSTSETTPSKTTPLKNSIKKSKNL